MKNVMILGDSYSTYQGYIPKEYGTYYKPKDGSGTYNVSQMDVDSTWWKRVFNSTGASLLLNNSWSGSTIGYTGYSNKDCSQTSSFIYRYKTLQKEEFFQNNAVDTLFVFGGTNDSWANAPLGEMQFSDWEEKDLFNVLPAICYLAYTLKTDLPNVKIVFIINSEIKPEIQDCMEAAAKRYGLTSIRLQDVDKVNGHPTEKGMAAISEQVLSALA